MIPPAHPAQGLFQTDLPHWLVVPPLTQPFAGKGCVLHPGIPFLMGSQWFCIPYLPMSCFSLLTGQAQLSCHRQHSHQRNFSGTIPAFLALFYTNDGITVVG